MDNLTFTCPLYPSGNRRWRHWAEKARAKEKYIANVILCVKSVMFAENALHDYRPMWEKAAVRIRLFFPTKRKRDVQNYTEAKWLIDSLIRAGVIRDDSREVIGVPDIDFGAVDRENPRCEVTVRRME